ncbi:integrase core domain-containing protein [Aliiroseovarius crassostreae]|uniref:integrase core domain-containing protein n=1 Tax=Aliiroseovarius crassostreae TaxID=154981 RepID=UPI0035CD3597
MGGSDCGRPGRCFRTWRKPEGPTETEIKDGFQARRIEGSKDRRIVKNWMTFYNLERPHSALDQRTPGEPYRAGLEEQKAA